MAIQVEESLLVVVCRRALTWVLMASDVPIENVVSHVNELVTTFRFVKEGFASIILLIIKTKLCLFFVFLVRSLLLTI